MKKGDPADGNDTWFRVLIMKSHAPKNRLHHSMFKGGAITAPSDPGQAWRSETSGRLRSLAGTAADIVADGELRVDRVRKAQQDAGNDPRPFEFKGVAYAIVEKLRGYPLAESDVIYDPVVNPYPDHAHANIVFYDKDPKEFEDKPLTLIAELIKLLRFAPKDEIGQHL